MISERKTLCPECNGRGYRDTPLSRVLSNSVPACWSCCLKCNGTGKVQNNENGASPTADSYPIPEATKVEFAVGKREGRRDFLAGLRKDQNPHPYATPAAAYWNVGWEMEREGQRWNLKPIQRRQK